MRVIANVFNVFIYIYLVAVIGVLATIWFSGDRWWFGTILLYGPRWIYALPLLVFVPLALTWRHQWLWPLALTALLVVWPLMGLNLHLNSRQDSEPPALRVMTYNVERWNVSGEEFSALLDEIQPDIAAVQELAPNRWDIPSHWYVKRARTSVVVSRYPIIRSEILMRGVGVSGLYCVIATPNGPVGFVCVDMLTPRRALKGILNGATIFNFSQIAHTQAMITKRWQESKQLSMWLKGFPESEKIIAGDFNLVVDSGIYRDFWSEFQNSYSQTEIGYGHTKRTKINIFNYTARIDHILSTPGLTPLRTWVGTDYGSDHLPLIAEFTRKNSQK